MTDTIRWSVFVEIVWSRSSRCHTLALVSGSTSHIFDMMAG